MAGEFISEALADFFVALFEFFQASFGAGIRAMIQFLQQVIVETPYPTCGASSTCTGDDTMPLAFGQTDEGDPWHALYNIYTDMAQPYAFVLLMISSILITVGYIFEDYIPGINTEENQKKLFGAFLGIILWWPIGVMLLSLSNALGLLLMSLGTGSGSPDSIGLVIIWDTVSANIEYLASSEGTESVILMVLTTLVWGVELLILVILGLLWFLRAVVLYIFMPIMPIFFALWAFAVPGVKPLQNIAKKCIGAFVTLTFVTIPGALIVGFFGSIAMIAAEIINGIFEDDGITIITAASESSSSASPAARVVEPAPSATADPVGAFSEALNAPMNPDLGSAGAVNPNLVTDIASVGTLSPQFMATFVFILMLSALPIAAALGPFLLVKASGGSAKAVLGAASFLGGPAGALAGAAVNVASKADTAKEVGGSFMSGLGKEAPAPDADDISGSGSLGGAGAATGKSSADKRSYADRVKAATTKTGVAYGAGRALLGTGRAGKKGGQFAAEKAPTREGMWGAYAMAQNINKNRGDYFEHGYGHNRANAGERVRVGLSDVAGKARRQEIAQNARDAVSDAKVRAKQKVSDVNERRRLIENLAEEKDPLEIAREASLIDPVMTDELQANKDKHGVALDSATIESLAQSGVVLDPGKAQYTSTADISPEDVLEHGEYRDKLEMTAAMIDKDLAHLIEKAEQTFGDDFQALYKFEDNGFSLQYELSESQARTALGQKIQEMDEMYAKNIEDVDFDTIIDNSETYAETKLEILGESLQEPRLSIVEQVVNQLDEFDESHYSSDDFYGLWMTDELEKAVNTYIAKHANISLANLPDESWATIKSYERGHKNLQQFQHVMDQIN